MSGKALVITLEHQVNEHEAFRVICSINQPGYPDQLAEVRATANRAMREMIHDALEEYAARDAAAAEAKD